MAHTNKTSQQCFMCGASLDRFIPSKPAEYYKEGKPVCSQACAAGPVSDARIKTVQHTPGPWVTNPGRCAVGPSGSRWKGPESIICASPTMPVDPKDKRTAWEHEANMRLIAAAPEMLESIKGVMGLLDADLDACEPWQDEIRKVRAALAKAEGK